MKKDFEALVNDIMRECEADGEPVTRTEAEEMAKMEMNAPRHQEQSVTEKKPRKPREPKIDADKVELINRIRNAVNLYTTDVGGITNLEVPNAQREITFEYNGANYSITLTKHR